jgi:hypothetical protein
MSSQTPADMPTSRYANNMLETEKDLSTHYEIAPAFSLNANKLLCLDLFEEIQEDYRACKVLKLCCGEYALFLLSPTRRL